MMSWIKASLSVAGGVGLMVLVSLVSVTGCAGRAELLPNKDPALRKTSAEFAADASRRFPYKADAPHAGQAPARAEIGYWADRVDLVNLSESQWDDVEIWVNRQYVVSLPRMEPHKLRSIPFQAFFNGQGASFPTDNNKIHVDKLEVMHDGKI